ncbi:MFS transporter [Paraburkholderia sediminicola]|uniref:MFS transporter n=1 Tax=Paraburkholderia sediminicola TaxID=458836 RepID=UPI0038BC7731
MEDRRNRNSILRQWGLVACLTVVSMLAQIDKNILVLMAGPIQRDFGASDVQISLLIGAAFAVANIVVGLPSGWLADRFNRRVVIAVGVAIWSLAVASNAVASAFVALLVARIIVGGAEALIPPSSYSLIRDGVDEQRRARALSVYTMSLMLGTGLSLVLGGPLLGAIQSAGIRSIPFIGTVSPWQVTLFLIGVVGLPMSLLIFLAKEPGRQQEASLDASRGLSGIGRYLVVNRAIFLPLFIFAVSHAMITFGLGSWMPTMTARRFHLGLREIGLMQGGLLLTMGPLGLWLAGMAMDRKGGRSLAGVARVGVLVTIAVTALTVTMCLIGSVTAFWIVDAMVVLFSWTFMAVTSTVVAKTAPASIVGAVMAIVLVLNGLIGQGGSPTLIALVSQHGFGGGHDALPQAMASVFAAAGAVALWAAVVLYRNFLRWDGVGVPVALHVHIGDAR